MPGRRSIPVQILGQEYRIRSDADPDVVRRAAALVDDTMTRVRDRTGTVDSLAVAVLAALNLANQLVALREECEASGRTVDPQRVSELIGLVESALAEPAAASH